MRTILVVLVANLSVCGANPPSPASSSPALAVPELAQTLAVSRGPASKGEPISLRGGGDMLCALREDAVPACIGEIGLALEPVVPGSDDGRYARSHTERPMAIEGLDLASLRASGYVRCVFAEPGALECWRREVAMNEGQYPRRLAIDRARSVAAEDQTCVVVESGELFCTGSESCSGRDATPGYDASQIVTIPGSESARSVEKSLKIGCAIREDSRVACWGKTLEDFKCTGNAAVVPELENVVEVAVGNYSACAIRADNRVLCWGANSGKTFGPPDPMFSTTPIEVPEAFPAVGIDSVSRGYAVLRADGSVVAWGSGLVKEEIEGPSRLNFARPAVDFVALSGMVCALLDNGDIQCEGYSVDFALEDGRPRPPFEGKQPWVEAPLYRLSKPPQN